MTKQRSLRPWQTLLACCLWCTVAIASAQLSVSQPWIRATVAQQSAAGAFMQLQAARDAQLVDVSSPLAASVEMHKMEMQGQTMKMHAVDAIDLPAGQQVVLGAGGFHLMLLGLKHQLVDGAQVPLVLTIKYADGKRATMSLLVPVRPLTFTAPAAAPARRN